MTPVFALYVGNPPLVKAAQLTEETADDIIRWTLGHRLTPERWISHAACWRVSAQFWYAPGAGWVGRPAPDGLIVGLRTRHGEHVAVEGDWIVQGVGGAFSIVHRDDFDDLYQPAVDDAPINEMRRP